MTKLSLNEWKLYYCACFWSHFNDMLIDFLQCTICTICTMHGIRMTFEMHIIHKLALSLPLYGALIPCHVVLTFDSLFMALVESFSASLSIFCFYSYCQHQKVIFLFRRINLWILWVKVIFFQLYTKMFFQQIFDHFPWNFFYPTELSSKCTKIQINWIENINKYITQ